MSPPSRITREDSGRAVDALLGFLHSRSKHLKSQLFEQDDFLYLHLSLRHFPSSSASRVTPFLIPLPHSLHPLDPSLTSLCLFAGDSLAGDARSAAASANLPFDSIIPLSDLRSDYVPFDSRRRLCDSHDIFFADRRIVPLLPRMIGNYFFKKRKIPIGVNLSRAGWTEAVRAACGSTRLFVGSGTGVGMKVGRVSMGREEVVDNLMAGVEGAVERVPGKWRNVRGVYVKGAHSVALPIYQAVPEMGMKIDVGGREKGEGLDGRSGGGLKKRKGGRIHDVGYLGGEVVDGEGGEGQGNDELGTEKKKKEKDGKGRRAGGEGAEERGNDEVEMEMKKKKKKKDGKGKKGRRAGEDEDEGEEKRIGGEFIELEAGRKMRKRAKKTGDCEVEERGVKDDLVVNVALAADESGHGEGKELSLKKKGKSKGRKGKKRLVS